MSAEFALALSEILQETGVKMSSEGNLEAPTRHALDWKNPDFYNADSLNRELERIFDICHGCRRCVSLCNTFPTLFDLVDNNPTLEVEGVDKKDYMKVVDQCYMCDLCYMTKCPYTPPHQWNVDFPHAMLRAKAIKYKKGEVRFSEKLLASTDIHGQFSGIPIVVQTINAVNSTKLMRNVMEKTLGVDKNAWLPSFATQKFRSAAAKSRQYTAKDGANTPGKVAIYSTCYVNYNEPGIGHDLLKVLDHNEIPYVLVDKEQCCGMPKLELGDLDGVAKAKEANIAHLVKYAKDGYAILSAIPSCTLMFKQEIPLMFPDCADTKLVQDMMWDPFEYLIARRKDGLLKTDFKKPLGKISYHIPCHGRVQNIGKKTEEFLKLVPATSITTVERCSGHAGTYGVKKAHHAMAKKIGKPVAKLMTTNPPDYISSDCQLAGHHIEQMITENNLVSDDTNPPQLVHPLSLARIAYGIE
ncbi:MAG: heterodisulfide reductase-related iron-sulfur binding cluster [Methylotenera sp.]|nr:heterodisulfide reductase-related iron-sulfur binding cluster [Methylotenera sp.]